MKTFKLRWWHRWGWSHCLIPHTSHPPDGFGSFECEAVVSAADESAAMLVIDEGYRERVLLRFSEVEELVPA